MTKDTSIHTCSSNGFPARAFQSMQKYPYNPPAIPSFFICQHKNLSLPSLPITNIPILQISPHPTNITRARAINVQSRGKSYLNFIFLPLGNVLPCSSDGGFTAQFL